MDPSNSSWETYHYTPLPSKLTTRVVELKAGIGGAMVECQLRVVDLEKNPPPPYEAISYVWGSSDRCIDMCCEGKHLSITRNLSQVLKQLRFPRMTRTVWADAICIDQEHAEERGFQVEIMSKVYSNAEQVLIWLGDDDRGEASDAFAFVEELFTDPRYQKHIMYDGPLHPSRESERLAYGVIGYLRNTRKLKCLDGILQRHWFRRIWVVQEVALARRAVLICGEYRCDWEKFSNVVTWLFASACRREYVSLKNGWAHCACLRDCAKSARKFDVGKRWWAAERFAASDELVCQLDVYGRLFSATEKSDFLYAALWHPLWRDIPGLLPSVAPNYTLTPAQVFLGFTLEIIRQSKRCSVLSLASLSHCVGEFADLPTWVARWDNNVNQLNQLILPSPPTAEKGSDASKASFVECEFLEASKTLRIKGIAFDIVASRSATWEMAWFNAHNKRYIQNPTPFISGWMLEHEWYNNKALRRAMTAICTCSGERVAPGSVRFNASVARFAHEVFRTNRPSLLQALDKQRSLLKAKPEAANRCLASIEPNRCVFFTERGSYGNGPACTRAGDVVCVLFGGRTPLLLRPCGGKRSRIVGDCYVHELMRGRLLDRFGCGEVSAEWFDVI
ncbi:MAG: hypothetical protein M1821_003067 [Bathelium mastoideum]|nr:MAG: hypothetical protein M1821_003067 [Bathelium mastoideum]